MSCFHMRMTLALFCLLTLLATAHAQFETRGSYTALPGSHPYSVAAGDFNHDGMLDLAVVNYCCQASGISILLGNGDGTFQKPVQYQAGDQPFYVVVADFNHDGNLDLAVANSLSNYISILLGNGDGTFRSVAKRPPVSGPVYVTAGDFNADGNIDLVALGSPGTTIDLLMGNGDGTFQKAVVTKPSFAVQTIGVGDFNRDGKLDLATAGQFGGASGVNMLLGNGDGTFRPGASYPGESSPSAIAVGDFNGDHKLDIAIANFLISEISVWLGNGDGTFQPAVNYAANFPIGVTTADLNGDGKLDLIAVHFDGSPGPAGAIVLTGNGDGTFQPGAFYPAGTETRYIAVGDFNGDRKPDLAVANYGGDDAIILLNTGVASFSPTTPLSFSPQLIGTTSVPQTVTLTNTGKTALSISSVSAHTPFQVSNTCGKSLAAGAACDLNIGFEPALQGSAMGLITVVDSASSKPQIIEVSGAGTVVQLAPQSLSFGDQKVDTGSTPEPVVVSNHGSEAVAMSAIGTSSRSFTETNNCPTQLNVGASCTINVTFKPARTGTFTATLSVADNGGGGSQVVALSGTGD